MGFKYESISGTYLKGSEKDAMIDAGVPFEIVSVQRDDDSQYGPRFVLKVLVPDTDTGDTEEKLLACPLGTVESRDRKLAALESYMEGDDAEPVVAKLTKIGRSIIVLHLDEDSGEFVQ